MEKAERDQILDRFEAEKRATGEGLLILTHDLERDERNAFHLPPSGDYCLQVGKDYEASTVSYANGTTRITVRKNREGRCGDRSNRCVNERSKRRGRTGNYPKEVGLMPSPYLAIPIFLLLEFGLAVAVGKFLGGGWWR